jgi:hypothetical protein
MDLGNGVGPLVNVMTTIEYWTALGAAGTIAYCVITAVTLIFLGIQLRSTRRDVLGQFVNQLGKDFEALQTEFEPLLLPGSGDVPSNERALPCLRFFERVKTLCDIGVLDVRILDAMFGYQFFSFVNNLKLQDNLLVEGDHYFPEVFALHQQLTTWYRKRGIDIPFADSDLALRDAKRYAENLAHYQEKGIKSR